ncbi:unnamed protein product [Prorocentrum cordatum]|uniref:Threonyl/alanyl tRNA synthetase SAD domain-containing protein n=2 Tax=Prorocentrum cordatum TaxID=2364126 RepID=A0ABN9VUB0_9DINO|nr:unnamed protein product [Polarella glacialis]
MESFDPTSKQGLPMLQLHDPVPQYAPDLGASMERVFSTLKRPLWRANFSFYEWSYEDDEGGAAAAVGIGERIYVKVEYETLLRLPEHPDHLVFTIRAHMDSLDDFAAAPRACAALAGQIRAMPDALLEYKGLDSSDKQSAVLAFLDAAAAPLAHKAEKLAAQAGKPEQDPKPKKVAEKPAAKPEAEPELPKPLGCLQALPETARETDTATALTEPVYFVDTYMFELAGCKLLEAVVAPEAPKGAPEGHVKLQIVLDRTVFHPQGGGQPTDVGELSAPSLPTLRVSFVSMRREDGGILHDCVVAQADADAWIGASKADGSDPQILCRVDAQTRRTNARVHSAGHLLDVAVQSLDLKWTPGKGYHFADGPYVEYVLGADSRKVDPKKPGDKEKLTADLQAAIDELVRAGGAVTIAQKAGVRTVAIGGLECPCGGTHVRDSSELGKVIVKKLKAKKGNMRLSYSVQ